MASHVSLAELLPRHRHYFKALPAGATHIDVYRVLELFGVTDPCIQHAVKKLLVAGGRGSKDAPRDVQEAIDSLTRWQEMRAEDNTDVVTADTIAAPYFGPDRRAKPMPFCTCPAPFTDCRGDGLGPGQRCLMASGVPNGN